MLNIIRPYSAFLNLIRKKPLTLSPLWNKIKLVKLKKKETWTQVRLSDAEKKMLDKQARRFGLSVSAYLRMLIYQKEEKK